MLISVVTPTYNRADLVGRAIASVLAQTMADLELIVVDDGSTDGTADVIRGFRDPRLRLLSLAANGGVSRARNAGIHAARGEWVAFLDSDDEWLPQKLERQLARVRAADDPRAGVVYCRYHRYDHLTRHRAVSPQRLVEGDVFERLLGGELPTGASIFMVRRSALLAVGGFREELSASEDTDLWLRLAEAGHRFAGVGEPLVVKHHHLRAHLSADLANRAAAITTLEREWSPVIRRRLGDAALRRWKARLDVTRLVTEYMWIREAVGSGHRARAWQGWLRMARRLPASPRFVLQGLVLVALGRRAYAGLAGCWNRRPRRAERQRPG